MAVSFAAAEKLAASVCSQTICSSGFGLVSQLEDFLMEGSLRGAMPQNRHDGTSLASKPPEEKAWSRPLPQLHLSVNSILLPAI